MFKNKYTMNKELYREYCVSIFMKKILFVGVLMVVIAMLSVITSSGVYRGINICAATVLAVLCVTIFTYLPTRLMDESMRIGGGKINETQVVFDKNIVMDEGKIHMEFEYAQVLKIFESKNFLALNIGKGSNILVKKDGFTEGTLEDFRSFIKDKTGA